MDCGIQCSIDKDCFSFKYENTICYHGGIQEPSNEIEAEVFMQKLIGIKGRVQKKIWYNFLTHPPLIEKNNKKTCFFWAF